MAIKKLRPTTPGRRQFAIVDYSGLSTERPLKGLRSIKKSQAGRNNQGKITVRHQGGGHKKFYRVVDFSSTDKAGVKGKVLSLQYDPNRTAFIALVQYEDGDKRYLLAEEQMKVGAEVLCADKAKAKAGNRMMLKNIPEGFDIYNIEITKGKGGQLVRSAGAYAKLVSHEKGMVQIQLPSGEVRYVHGECYATIGKGTNTDHANESYGKAGRMRWKGIRPQVRGKAMNPIDHPHGGGEGLQSIGMKHPKTPWGKPALGVKTRKRSKKSHMIIQRRK